MSKESNQPLLDNQTESVSKIETIKNLIFGDHIEQYDSEFETLKKDILSKREELKQLLEDTTKELNTLVDNLSTDLNIRITEVENNFNDTLDNIEAKKVNKKTLGELLIKLGNQISE